MTGKNGIVAEPIALAGDVSAPSDFPTSVNVFRRIVSYLASAVLFFAVAFGLGSIVLLVMDRWALDKAVTIASWFTGALLGLERSDRTHTHRWTCTCGAVR